MKLCFPVCRNEGTQSRVFGHLRLAPLLLVVDSETEEIIEIDNQKLRDLRGLERFQALIGNEQIDALLTPEAGMGAVKNLQLLGIKVFQTEPGTIAENIAAFGENKLAVFNKEISDMNGQGKGMGRGMGQGRGMNCRGAGMGQGCGMGRKQGQQVFGRGSGRMQTPVDAETVEPGMGMGRGRGQGQGLGRKFGRAKW